MENLNLNIWVKRIFIWEHWIKMLKKNHENPSIGIILCKTKDNNIVEISLNRSVSPTIISQYKTKLTDKELLRNKLNELFDSILDKE